MDLKEQIEQYQKNPRTKLRMLKMELVATRIFLPFIKVYKRGDLLHNLTEYMNKCIQEISQGEMKGVCHDINWLHENSIKDEEFEEIFKEFSFYNIWKFRKNALFVDNLRDVEFKSFEYFNYLLKQYCAIKDYIEFKEEEILNKVWRKE